MPSPHLSSGLTDRLARTPSPLIPALLAAMAEALAAASLSRATGLAIPLPEYTTGGLAGAKGMGASYGLTAGNTGTGAGAE